MLTSPAGTLAFVVALAGMEAVAAATHRYVMLGPLWCLHRSHHVAARPGGRRPRFELNDLFVIAFALPAIALLAAGRAFASPIAWGAGAGMTAYGVLYALAHDGLVHRRFPMPRAGRSRYLRRLVSAHRLHHAVRTREGAVSFGFLWPPRDVGDVARRLRARPDRARTSDARP
jgi:beta-carotene 3-hydroxylase